MMNEMWSERNTVLTVKCNMCGSVKAIYVREEDYDEFCSPDRRNIQDVFPYLSAEERELLLSHTCNECWNKMFSFEEEDEDDEEFLSQFNEYYNDNVSCEEMKGC